MAMKKAGKVDHAARRQLGASRSMGQIQRPGPAQLAMQEVQRKLPQPQKSRAGVRAQVTQKSASVSKLPSPGESPPKAVRPQPDATPTHRLSIDGSMGAAVYFSALAQQGAQNPTPQRTVASSSRELLQFVRAQHPAAIDTRKYKQPETEPNSGGHRDSPISPDRVSRQGKMRTSGSQSVTSLPQPAYTLPKVIAKLAFRTRTGSISGVPKAHNQDNFLMNNDFAGCKNQCLFGVFDGHGTDYAGVSGHDVSAFVKKTLPTLLETHLPKSLSHSTFPAPVDEELRHIRAAFSTAYKGLNSELQRRPSIDTSFSGTTVVSVLLRGTLAVGANAGDSRAILGKKTEGRWTAVPLSNDHKPDDPSERERIVKAGGRVEPFRGRTQIDETGQLQGPARVWLAEEDIPGLAMSRSIGDFVAAQVGVVAEPEVLHVELAKEHKFLVLASDGVWEFISSQAVLVTQCVEMVAPFYESGNIEGACDKLVKESVAYWKRVRPT